MDTMKVLLVHKIAALFASQTITAPTVRQPLGLHTAAGLMMQPHVVIGLLENKDIYILVPCIKFWYGVSSIACFAVWCPFVGRFIT
jgi:hypothetical protein